MASAACGRNLMKHGILFISLLLILTLLTACSGPSGDVSAAESSSADVSQAAQEETSGPEQSSASSSSGDAQRQASLEQRARELVVLMREGDFDSVAAQFNEQMAAALTADALKEGWDSTVLPLGAYVNILSVSSVLDGENCLVSVIDEYEGNGILVQISFDGSDAIQGLWITYQDLTGITGEIPSAPEGVVEEEISIEGDPAYPLAGTLTLPEGTDNPPVVILIHGSGSSDRNETISGNTPFRDIAWGLAERGIASIRYDKRYYTYPDAASDPASVTIEAEVLEDADAAIALAMADDRLDHSRVYILGHSLGGMLTPAIAASHPQLAGAISMAGSLRKLWDISYDQNMAAAEAARPNLSEDESFILNMQLAQVESDVAALNELSEAGQLKDLSALPEDMTPDTLLLGIPLSYWASLDQYCGMNFIDEVTMPMLILQGDADFQVYADVDYPLWQEALAGRDNVTFHLYEGLNHLMMPSQGRQDISEYAVKNQVSGEVIDDIAAFITTAS